MSAKIDNILQYFDRTAEQFFSKEEFAARLKAGRKLRIKYGVDVTAPTLHIGHAVNLWLMRYMQDLGHKVVFVIGDFTTRIGDPDGRLETRPVISKAEIEKNAKAFIEQTRMVLRFDDPELLEVRRNSEWFDKMGLQEFLDLIKTVTHAKLMSRDMFKMRLKAKKEIHMHEMLYPVLQGWDSVAVESDMTVIGSDQLFNEMMGRHFQEKRGQKPQTIITTKITPGIDGKAKQNKSADNYIGLAHSPRDKFGRVMRIPDDLIEEYFRVYTDVPLDEIERMSDDIARRPRQMKAKLAYAIVGRYHGHEVAVAENKWFEETFSYRKIPGDIPELAVLEPKLTVLELVRLAHPDKSKSHSRRLITQGAVELNDRKIRDPDETVIVDTNDILHIGKREWYRINLVRLNEFETERLWMKPLEAEDIDSIRANLPSWEIAKYLGKLPASKKETEQIAREVYKKVIFKPEPKDEWLWKISQKKKPGEIIGVAHLRKDAARGNENIWLAEAFHAGGYMEEAMDAINEHAFANLGFSKMVFKNAFTYASAPQEMEVLRRRFIGMTSDARNREDPEGTWGFTKDGWMLMKQQLNELTPEMNTLMTDTNQKTRRETTQRLKSGFVREQAAQAQKFQAQKLQQQKAFEQKQLDQKKLEQKAREEKTFAEQLKAKRAPREPEAPAPRSPPKPTTKA